MAEVAWLVHSRQEETEGGPHRNLQLLPGTMIVSETVAQCVPGCSDKSPVQGNIGFLSFFLH